MEISCGTQGPTRAGGLWHAAGRALCITSVTSQESVMLGISRMTRLALEQRESPSQPARRARSLVLQTHATNKVLETGIGAQIVKQEVGLEGPGNV